MFPIYLLLISYQKMHVQLLLLCKSLLKIVKVIPYMGTTFLSGMQELKGVKGGRECDASFNLYETTKLGHDAGV